MLQRARKFLTSGAPDAGALSEPRLVGLMLTATVATAVLIVLTLPTATSDGKAFTLGVVVAGGAAAAAAGYVGMPRLAWLPFLPASTAIGVLAAETGGSASPYWPLLLVLLVGGATIPRLQDLLVVALLVIAAVLSPLAYEPLSTYATTANALTVAGWLLASAIVARVSANTRSARRRVEERTRLVSSVLGALPQQAAVVDASGRILLTNDAWDRVHVLGGAAPGTFAPGATYETACRNRAGVDTDVEADLIDDLSRVLDGSIVTAVSELSWELLVGQHHRFTVRTSALPDGLGAVITHEDITPLVEAEHTREASLEQLRELDRRKNALLQAVSHDVRGPLTVIGGVADILHHKLDELDRTDLGKLADGLAHQYQRLARLLSGMLALAHEGNGSPTAVTLEPTNLCDAICTALDGVHHDGRHISVNGPHPDAVVRVDPSLLGCILERLIDNAVRHTPDKTPIQIDVHLTDDRTLVICVDDEGPGIPAEEHERVFLPFEKGSDSDPHDPGAGIGLAVVRHAARLHGGDAWIDTADRKGTSLRAKLTIDPT